jgi:hypothetical protein
MSTTRRGFVQLLAALVGAVMVAPVRAAGRRKGFARVHRLEGVSGTVSGWMPLEEAESLMARDMADMAATMARGRIYPEVREPAWLTQAVEAHGGR